MIAANSISQLFRQHPNRGNLFRGFSKASVMNDCRLAQDTFVLRQVISVFIIIFINILYVRLFQFLFHIVI
jgi:hypothetical protein